MVQKRCDDPAQSGSEPIAGTTEELIPVWRVSRLMPHLTPVIKIIGIRVDSPTRVAGANERLRSFEFGREIPQWDVTLPERFHDGGRFRGNATG